MSTPQQAGSPLNAFPDVASGVDCPEAVIPDEDLLALAALPESMKSDNQEVTERSLSDLIQLDEYLRARKAACAANANPAVAGWGQIKVHKVVPPSSTGV